MVVFLCVVFLLSSITILFILITVLFTPITTLFTPITTLFTPIIILSFLIMITLHKSFSFSRTSLPSPLLSQKQQLH